MSIKENFEWLQELVMDMFSEVTGMHGGVDVDTVVYCRNAPQLWRKICYKLNINSPFEAGLTTIADYVEAFSAIVEKRNQKRQAFLDGLTEFVASLTGKKYAPKEKLFDEPDCFPELQIDPDDQKNQERREWIQRNLKLLQLHNAIRKKYKFYGKLTRFCYAETLGEITDLIVGKKILLQ